MRISDEQRVLFINAAVLVLIILLLWMMPRSFITPAPASDTPPPPHEDALRTQGDETILVLIGEYNFDYTPHYQAAITDTVGLCTSMPFIDQAGCPKPADERAFTLTNATASGWLGYAVMPSDDAARRLLSEYASLTHDASGGYLHVSSDITEISDYALVDSPDQFVLFYHPAGGRFEHAWLARFGQIIIYGYENTTDQRISRKFTHAFSEDLRRKAMAHYNLSLQALGAR